MSGEVKLEYDERYLRSTFDRIASFTVGAEEELLLLDPAVGLPRPVAGLAPALFPDDSRVVGAFRASQIEIVSPVCVAVADVARELSAVRRSLTARLAPDAVPVATGAHPLALATGSVADAPRYEAIAREQPWAARHMLTCGLHVHIAVGGADRALAVHNAVRSYLPEIVALAANAPFHAGRDTRMATVRPMMNRTLSRSGVPPAFSSLCELSGFLVWGERSSTVPDASRLWWDVRLQPANATLEIRAADTQTRVADAAAIIAFIQCLVFDLAERYDARKKLPVHDRDRINEAMFVAARDGLSGHLPDLDSGELSPASVRIRLLIDRLVDAALELGCTSELGDVQRLVIDGGGAQYQREIVAADGIGGLVDQLALRTADPIGDGCDTPSLSLVGSRRRRECVAPR